MTAAPVALALLAAVLLGASAALQRQALAGAAGRGSSLLSGAARQPLWWVGVACSLGALGAQFTALRLGPLLLVQVVLLLGVVASALVEWLAFSVRPRARARAGMVLTTAGLAGVLALLQPAAGAAGAAPAGGSLLRLGVGVLAAGVLAGVLRRRTGGALGLAVATGAGYGLTAVAMKSVGAQAGLGWGEPLGHVALWVALLVGPAAVVLSQHALAGPGSAAVTVSTIATAELGVVTAASTWFGERVAAGPVELALAAAAGAVAVVGLALSHAPSPGTPPGAPRRRRGGGPGHAPPRSVARTSISPRAATPLPSAAAGGSCVSR